MHARWVGAGFDNQLSKLFPLWEIDHKIMHILQKTKWNFSRYLNNMRMWLVSVRCQNARQSVEVNVQQMAATYSWVHNATSELHRREHGLRLRNPKKDRPDADCARLRLGQQRASVEEYQPAWKATGARCGSNTYIHVFVCTGLSYSDGSAPVVMS